MSPRRAAFMLLLVAGLAGCGYSRTPVPAFITPAPPQGFRVLRLPAAGVTISVPRNWLVGAAGTPPLVAVVASGDAEAAVWRYVRTAPLPRGRVRMAAAVQRLIAAARRREPGIQVIRARVVHLRGVRGVELNALEHIKGQLRRVRSTHLYLGHTEFVLEEYAPPDLFHSVDHEVFAPLRRSMRLVATT